MTNNSPLVPVATSVSLATVTSVALGGGSVGLVALGGGIAIPAAIASFTVGAVGWVLGSIFNLFRPSPRHDVINVTAVAVVDDEPPALPEVTSLMLAYDMELGLLAQGIF